MDKEQTQDIKKLIAGFKARETLLTAYRMGCRKAPPAKAFYDIERAKEIVKKYDNS